MTDVYTEKLREFHDKLALPNHREPQFNLSPTQANLRINLLKEEVVEEFVPAVRAYQYAQTQYNDAEIANQLVEIGDAIADILYVTFGAAITFGLDPLALFLEVHRSNMTKIWPDGSIRRRGADQKIIKPPTYSPANLRPIIFKEKEK